MLHVPIGSNTFGLTQPSTTARPAAAQGNATDKDIIISNAQFVTSTNESSSKPPLSAGVEFPVAAGSNIYARIQSSGTPDPYELVVYGAGG